MRKKTKRVVIKEELVELTGDFKLAIVLNQMIYWSERVADFDKFIKEEKDRLSSENIDSSNISYQNGWIYKKADELADECMITNSEATMRRYLEKLVESGWLDARRNPRFKWDKTLQYRLNLKHIQQALFAMGFCLDGYRIELQIDKKQNEDSNFQNESTNFQNGDSKFQNERAIPEITSKITSEIKKKEEEEGNPESENPFRFFEKNGFGTIGGHISEKISAWCDDLSNELVLEAMKIAVERGAKSWSYVEKILINWADKQIKTVDQANALILAFKEKHSKQQGNTKKGYVRTEKLPNWFNEDDQPSVTENKSDADMARKQAELQETLKKLRESNKESE